MRPELSLGCVRLRKQVRIVATGDRWIVKQRRERGGN